MLMFEGFYGAIDGFFENKEKEYWPINIDQMLIRMKARSGMECFQRNRRRAKNS